MIDATHTTVGGAERRRGLGLSAPVIVLLAAIAAIREPLHELSRNTSQRHDFRTAEEV